MGRLTMKKGSRSRRTCNEKQSSITTESAEGRHAKAEMVVSLPPPLLPSSPYSRLLCTTYHRLPLTQYTITDPSPHDVSTQPRNEEYPLPEHPNFPDFTPRQCTDTHIEARREERPSSSATTHQLELCTGMKLAALIGDGRTETPKTMTKRNCNDSGFCTGIITRLTPGSTAGPRTAEEEELCKENAPEAAVVVVAVEKGVNLPDDEKEEDEEEEVSGESCSAVENNCGLLYGYQHSQEQGKPQYTSDKFLSRPTQTSALISHRVNVKPVRIDNGQMTAGELVLCVDDRVPPLPQFPDEKLVVTNQTSLDFLGKRDRMDGVPAIPLIGFPHDPPLLPPPPLLHSPPPPTPSTPLSGQRFLNLRHSDVRPFVCNMS